jgi:predicted MPP superfamily phosphohydrolase
MGFVVFIASALATLLGSHYLLYATTVRFLSIESRSVRVVLMVVLMFLSLSFILSAILVRLHADPVTCGLSALASFWMGLVIYLIPAMGLVWLVHGASRLAGLAPDMRIVCLGLYGLALAVVVYGTLNAWSPRVTRVEVAIEGLPEQWRGATVVHLSDVHLGAVRGPGYMRDVARRVRALGPDLVLITGDLFDGMSGDLGRFVGPIDELEARRGVFFVSGNHEGYLGLDGPLAALARTRIRVLDNEVVEVDGLQIVGIAFPEHDRRARAEAGIRVGERIDPDKPSILMYHTPTNVVGSRGGRAKQQTSTYISPDTDFAFAREHGIDLQLSGHTHEGQFWPFTWAAHRIWKGYDYGLHGIGGFQIYTTRGTGTWGPPIRVGSRSEIVAITLR